MKWFGKLVGLGLFLFAANGILNHFRRAGKNIKKEVVTEVPGSMGKTVIINNQPTNGSSTPVIKFSGSRISRRISDVI